MRFFIASSLPYQGGRQRIAYLGEDTVMPITFFLPIF